MSTLDAYLLFHCQDLADRFHWRTRRTNFSLAAAMLFLAALVFLLSTSLAFDFERRDAVWLVLLALVATAEKARAMESYALSRLSAGLGYKNPLSVSFVPSIVRLLLLLGLVVIVLESLVRVQVEETPLLIFRAGLILTLFFGFAGAYFFACDPRPIPKGHIRY